MLYRTPFLQELYAGQYIVLAGLATGFTVGPHVLMSLLLIIRQGWLMAASQAVGFILTLNPFENLTPIPQGIVGLFMLSIGFIAYVLIAASGTVASEGHCGDLKPAGSDRFALSHWLAARAVICPFCSTMDSSSDTLCSALLCCCRAAPC